MGVRRATSRARLFEINKLGKASSSLAGAGISPAVVDSTIHRKGYEVITEIAVDLGTSRTTSLSSSTTAGDVIGISASLVTNHQVANLITLNTATNGHLVAVEMFCLETPVGGQTDIDLTLNSSATKKFDDAGAGTLLVDAGAAWVQGDFRSYTGSMPLASASLAATGNVPNDSYSLYLINGAAGTVGGYTAGKYVIRLHGIIQPDNI